MKYCVTINNKRYEVEVEKGNAAILKKTEEAISAAEVKNPADVQAAATTVAPKVIETLEKPVETGRESVKAPMAGVIVDVKTRVGLAVRKGDILVILEAMKMENEITAPVDGIVTDIKTAKGANVSPEDVLVVLK